MANIPRDDLGTQRLEEDNAAKTATVPVAPTAASPALRPQASPTPSVPTEAFEERRRGERRQRQERRGANQSILLDTRSHHERRTHERRQHHGHRGERQSIGINVYI